MSQSVSDYLDRLTERSDLLWPLAPEVESLKATPALQPMADVRIITLCPYGTLLHIDQGELVHLHPQSIRTQIALEKTIKEFNMWNSMSRKPGQPWEYMLQQYTKLIDDRRMTGTRRKGDIPEIDSAAIWQKIVERLQKNEYQYDVDAMGDAAELGAKIAYFFHASMQGVRASAHAAETLLQLKNAGIRTGLLGDGQVFTVPQIFRALKKQLPMESPGQVLSSECIAISTQVGVRLPSPSLFEHARDLFSSLGFEPQQVLHVSHRHLGDLTEARKVGFRTALYAADKQTCVVDKASLRDPDLRPDRLITDLRQLRDLLQL